MWVIHGAQITQICPQPPTDRGSELHQLQHLLHRLKPMGGSFGKWGLVPTTSSGSPTMRGGNESPRPCRGLLHSRIREIVIEPGGIGVRWESQETTFVLRVGRALIAGDCLTCMLTQDLDLAGGVRHDQPCSLGQPRIPQSSLIEDLPQTIDVGGIPPTGAQASIERQDPTALRPVGLWRTGIERSGSPGAPYRVGGAVSRMTAPYRSLRIRIE